MPSIYGIFLDSKKLLNTFTSVIFWGSEYVAKGTITIEEAIIMLIIN